MDFAKTIANKLSACINMRQGVVWGIFMGLIVWVINVAVTTPPDYHGATTAAIKQAFYTFLIGGFLARVATVLVARPGKPWLVITVATVVSTLLTSVLVLLVHSVRGTPHPLWSSMPTIVIAIVVFPVMTTRMYRAAHAGDQPIVADVNPG